MAKLSMCFLTKDLKQNPIALLDYVIKAMNLQNDAELSRLLDINQATISRIRNQIPKLSGLKHNITDGHILAIYDATGLSIEEIRSILYQQKFYPHAKPPYKVIAEQREAEEAERLAKQKAFREKVTKWEQPRR